MNEIKLELIKKIPYMSRHDANALVNRCLGENKYVEELLEYSSFVDGNIANKVIEAVINKDIELEKLLMAINPFTDKYLNDLIVRLCIQKKVSAEGLVGKAFPFTSVGVADEIAKYAIKEGCNPESLLNAAPPFVTADMAEQIFEYAFSKRINPGYFSNKDYSVLHSSIAEKIGVYVEQYNNNTDNDIQLRLVRVFNEAGVFLNPEDPNEPLLLDSLHYISIICEIENEFDVEISDEVLSENILSSFQDFLNLINKE